MGAFGLTIIDRLGHGDAVAGYASFAFIVAIAFVVFTLITVFNVKEQVEVKPSAEKVNFKQTINIIRKNDQLVVFIGIVLGMNLIMQISGGTSLYYFTYVVGNQNLNQVFYGFSGLAEIAGLMMFPILTIKIGRESVFKIASILPVIGFIMLLAFGFLAPLSGWLVGVGLSLVGYLPGVEQTAATIFGLKVLMIGIPVVCAIVMFAIYKKKYKLNGEFHDQVLKSLSKGNENTLNNAM